MAVMIGGLVGMVYLQVVHFGATQVHTIPTYVHISSPEGSGVQGLHTHTHTHTQNVNS